MRASDARAAFTLVELAIVLVILGLLVGAVVTGQNLIRNAELRSVVTEFQTYKTAIRTFQDTYLALPGDIQHTLASRLGFTARSGGLGAGNGDGHLTVNAAPDNLQPTRIAWGEPVLFWSDLAQAGLIEGSYAGTKNQVYNITSGFITASTWVEGGFPFDVDEAWNMDTKIDDGLPLSGKVVTQYLSVSNAPLWMNLNRDADLETVSTSPSSTSCIDNGGSSGAEFNYTLNSSGGCHLSFRF